MYTAPQFSAQRAREGVNRSGAWGLTKFQNLIDWIISFSCTELFSLQIISLSIIDIIWTAVAFVKKNIFFLNVCRKWLDWFFISKFNNYHSTQFNELIKVYYSDFFRKKSPRSLCLQSVIILIPNSEKAFFVLRENSSSRFSCNLLFVSTINGFLSRF